MLARLIGWRRDGRRSDDASSECTVTLSSADSDLTRAINIMRVMGLSLNTTAMAMVPHAAMAIEAYRKLDREASADANAGRKC